jgi:hypothetical protein
MVGGLRGKDQVRNLGIEVYPKAQVLKEGAAAATFGAVHTLTANLESSDSLDKVASFYKSKFPNAVVTTSDEGQLHHRLQ